jgi:prolyl-tRNA synthetase
VYKGREEEVVARCRSLKDELASHGLRVALDDRKEITPGSKYFTWEQRGASIRIDLGPRDLDAGTMVLVRRETLEKKVIQANSLMDEVKAMLVAIDGNLAARAEVWMRERQYFVASIEKVKKKLDEIGGIAEGPWCGERECGEGLELKVDARMLGVPFTGGSSVAGARCMGCGKEASKSIRMGRSY